MEILYTSTHIEVDLVKNLLLQLFPERKVFCWDFISNEPEGWNSQDERSIVFNLAYASELIQFNHCLTIYRFPTLGENERALFLARKLSTAFEIEVFTGYQHPANPKDPYYGILFKKGISYLIDDSNSDLADGTGLPVTVIGSWHIPDYTFDAWGNLVQ
jgi:hypothetical protein